MNQLNYRNFFTNLFGATAGATANAALVMNYTLFAGGGRSAAIQAARDQVRLSELEVQRQLQQLILDVTNDYYLAQQAKVQVQIAEAAVANAQVTLRDATAFEQAGIGTLLDVLTAEVNLANAQQNLNQARNLEITTRRQLAQRLNVNQMVDVAIAERVEPAEKWSLSLEDSILLAYQNRVELEQQLLRRRIALSNRQLALATTRPQLSLFASGNMLDKVTDDLGPRFGYGVGLQMQLALFDGGNARASAARQEALAASAEEQYANQKDSIRLEVETAYINLKANEKNIATAQTAATQATEGLRLARLRFQAGVGTQQEVTNAEANLTQAQGNLLAAILDYNRSLAALKRAVGYPERTGLGGRQ
nr:TolC family protein [Thermosynechococcus sp. NK55a]